MIILSVMVVSGYFGFLILKPINLLTSSSNESFLASVNCIMDVAENDFEMEAILNIQSSVNGSCIFRSFNPKEWVYTILWFFTTATEIPTTLLSCMMVLIAASAFSACEKTAVETKWGQVETQYQRRMDLIPNIATATAIANSKLLLPAVKESVVDFS